MTSSKRESTLWILAVACLIAGTWGLVNYLRKGHLVAAYGSYVPWGLWVASYIYFIGLSAGAFLVSDLVYVFRVRQLETFGPPALLTALACWVASMLSIWLDLGHPARVWRLIFCTNFGSVMGWMAWFYSAYFILLTAQLWLAMRPTMVQRARTGSRLARLLCCHRGEYDERAKQRDRHRMQLLGAAGIPLVIAFNGGAGALFGVVGARPYWHSGLLPILFLTGALLSGAALLAALAWLLRPSGSDRETGNRVVFLGRMILPLVLLYMLLEFSEFTIVGYASVPAHASSLELVLFGPYWWVFWIIHVGFGIVAPLLLLAGKGRSPVAVATAGALIAITFLAVRVNIVVPGLAVEELHGLSRAYVDARLTFDYFPTLTEWLVQLWITALAGLLFLTGCCCLPVFSRMETSHG